MAQNDQNKGLELQVPGMDQFKDLKFLQSETEPTDLVVQLPDGFEVVFPNYIALAQAGTPPAITLEDGTVIPGVEIVTLIDNLNYDLIAPAAGNEGDAPNGGGASFSADPSGLLGDDLDHGPYAGGIEIADRVGFDQRPGITTDGEESSPAPTPTATTTPDPTPTPTPTPTPEPNVIAIEDNNGDTYSTLYRALTNDHMDMKTVFVDDASAVSSAVYGMPNTDLRVRPQADGELTINLKTIAAGGIDWDGIRIEVKAGETITITPDSNGSYYYGLDTDGDPHTGTTFGIVDPFPMFNPYPVGWEIEHSTDSGSGLPNGPITYLAHADGFVYVGTGFNAGSGIADYYTQIVVNDNHIIEGTSGNDNLVSGDDADYLSGLAGNDTLTGNGGDDVLVGGTGNDSLDGGAGSDRFMFQSINDGQDTIYNFDTGAGGDIVNLDALFDALNIASGDREVIFDQVTIPGSTILTIQDDNPASPPGTEHPDAALANFEITLDGISVASLTSDNLVVDES